MINLKKEKKRICTVRFNAITHDAVGAKLKKKKEGSVSNLINTLAKAYNNGDEKLCTFVNEVHEKRVKDFASTLSLGSDIDTAVKSMRKSRALQGKERRSRNTVVEIFLTYYLKEM